MSIDVTIIDGPLPAFDPGATKRDGLAPAPAASAGAGAVLIFEGVVREREGDGKVAALNYQAYEPMAQKTITNIAHDLIERHKLVAVRVEHSRGRVAVGERSFRLIIEAPHRKEALAAADEFIDRLKKDVPIWKEPVWLTRSV